MRRHLCAFTAASALLVGVYACSTSQAGGGNDVTLQAEAGIGLDGARHAEAAKDDGAGVDSATDAGLDGLDGSMLDADAALGIPGVRFIGRFDTTPAAGPKVGFPASEIVARFSGTVVKATFADEMVDNDYGLSRWEVLIDGSSSVLSLARAQTTYTLASGLPPGIHTVRLVKLTEGQVGTSQFMGFDFTGGVLLAPPAPATRHLEFLGDSASSGYGVECADPALKFSAATENARKAYPALIAADLSADHLNLSVAGKGLYWNYARAIDPEVYSIIYPRTLPFNTGSTWSFADYTPDVVWMTLGGNDYDQPNAGDGGTGDGGVPGDPPPPFAAFETKYDEMVTLVRTKHPNAHIFCVVAASLGNDYPAGYSAYTNVKTAATDVVAAKNAGGDNKVYFFEFTRSTGADLTGCEFHPNPAKHRAMADEAIVAIKTKTGWP